MNDPSIASSAATAATPRYALPIVALVLSVAGLCLCPLAPIGCILGIIAWVRISKEPQLPGQVFAIIATFLPVATVPVVGILAAIAIPNFVKFQGRSKQGECKAALRTLHTQALAYRAEHSTFPSTFAELGWEAHPGARYSYFLSDSEVSPATAPQLNAADLDSHKAEIVTKQIFSAGPGAPDEFRAACVGNIDTDPTLDIWTISSDDPSPTEIQNDLLE
jgi:type IV pilus assembly protein PilA